MYTPSILLHMRKSVIGVKDQRAGTKRAVQTQKLAGDLNLVFRRALVPSDMGLSAFAQ